MKKIKRSVAVEAGIPFYNTGKPCKYGHLSDRETVSGKCLECSTIYQREYKRKQREKFRSAKIHANQAVT